MSFKDKRILIVNLNWIGDVLFSTAAIRLLKELYPTSFLACMIPPRCKEILENNPYVDELILFDERTKDRSFLSKLKLIVFLRKKKFDTVFLFHRSFTRALICRLAGIPERIGYDRRKTNFLLTKKVKLEPTAHRVDYFLNLLRVKDLTEANKEYQFFVKEEDRLFAEEFLKKHNIGIEDKLVSLNPGGNWLLKRWNAENFAVLGDLVAEKYKAKILITGSEKDKELALNISGAMKHKPVICAGETTLGQLAALFEKSRVVVSADSGPMHIAVSIKAPVVALFGPTSPEITGPIGSGKSVVMREDTGCVIPCYELSCPSNKCMRAITPQKVIRLIDEEKLL
ncbi:MAG: lipopolysaccharide heptosyltransferase II [Candidatus Omnitrophota bacterium]